MSQAIKVTLHTSAADLCRAPRSVAFMNVVHTLTISVPLFKQWRAKERCTVTFTEITATRRRDQKTVKRRQNEGTFTVLVLPPRRDVGKEMHFEQITAGTVGFAVMRS